MLTTAGHERSATATATSRQRVAALKLVLFLLVNQANERYVPAESVYACEADDAIAELERQQVRAFSEKEKSVFRREVARAVRVLALLAQEVSRVHQHAARAIVSTYWSCVTESPDLPSR